QPAAAPAPAHAAAPAQVQKPARPVSREDAIPESWRLDPNYRAMLSTMAIYELDKAGTGAGVIAHPSLKLLLRQRAFQPLFQQKGFSEVMLRPEFKGFLDRLGSRMKLAKVMRVIRAVIWWLGFVGLGVLVYFKTESLPLMTKLSELLRKLPAGKLKENVFVWFPRSVWFGVAILVLWILLWLLFMPFMRVKYGFCPTCDQFGFLRGNTCAKCGKSLRGPG
ncbi:MAG: hypothetical protein RDV41_06685, partial [Planctomycetota bacterium]|nr:hypothetical protein [Planctomycetota bacterium]